MTVKLGKTRGKGGRPTKSKQVRMRKRCEEEYRKYHSATYAANILDYNVNTVEKYFRGFQETQLEETNTEFVLKQRSAKDRVVTKLEEIIEDLDNQLTRMYKELDKNDNEVDKARYESMVTNTLKLKAELWQHKAGIEITPTLDITFEKLLEEKYGSNRIEEIRPSKPVVR